MRHFNPESGPQPKVYNRGVEVRGAERMLFVAGQVGERADGSLGETMAEQATIAVENMRAVLAGAGMTTANVVKFTIFLTDEARTGEFMQSAAGLLPSPPPAVTLLYVKALASPKMLVEIEAIAVA